MSRTLAIITVALAFLAVAASVEHLLASEHHNPGYALFPGTIRTHVALGAVYLLLALPQFSARLRRQRPRLHRIAGRAAVFAGVASGATALAITLLFPFSGPPAIAVVGPFAVLFVFSMLRGIQLARAHRFADHREWMIRALAVATSIATMRLLFVPSLILLGDTEEIARWLSLASFGLAFAIHVGVAELWIRSTRPAQPDAKPDAHSPRTRAQAPEGIAPAAR